MEGTTDMKILIPIDFQDVFKKTGIKSGKLCRSKAFGWGVYSSGEPHFAEYLPPNQHNGRKVKKVKIVNNSWELTV